MTSMKVGTSSPQPLSSTRVSSTPSKTPTEPRKLPEVPIHIYIQRLLKTQSPLAIRMRKAIPHEVLSIPTQHRRVVSDTFSNTQHRLTRARLRRRENTTQVRTERTQGDGKTTPGNVEEGVKTVRFARDSSEGALGTRAASTARLLTINTSPRALSTRRSDEIIELRHTCKSARSTVRRERRIVKRKKRKLISDWHRCSIAVDNALNIDVNGYLPPSLIDYKQKRAELRAARGYTPQIQAPINLKKEVVEEYRRDLLKKALQRNIDKDLRYIYTFGSCSAAGT